MAKHKEFTVATDVQVYFCDPQSPWQRGTNENTNLLLRQYFPRGTDLSPISQAQLDQVSLRLNQRQEKPWDSRLLRVDFEQVLRRPYEPAPQTGKVPASTLLLKSPCSVRPSRQHAWMPQLILGVCFTEPLPAGCTVHRRRESADRISR